MKSIKFLDAFIGEMAALFPDEYFHIGGDEVNGKQWDANPRIQEFMRAQGIKEQRRAAGVFHTPCAGHRGEAREEDDRLG